VRLDRVAIRFHDLARDRTPQIAAGERLKEAGLRQLEAELQRVPV
jgi:hypothetical protein